MTTPAPEGHRSVHTAPEIRIHYLRPPEQVTVYRQRLVHDDGRVKVTLARDLPFDPPLRIEGKVALERGSDAVWFTFPGAWHDIGRFHRADGSLTGIYANLITPCVFQPGGDWETTDLFLDLWIPARDRDRDRDRARDATEGAGAADAGPAFAPILLDEPEFEAAVDAGHLSPRHADRAREEVRRIRELAAAGRWPPPVVGAWTRDRALRAVGAPDTPDPGG